MVIFVIQNMPNYNRFPVNCYLKVTCNICTIKKFETSKVEKNSIPINFKSKNQSEL